MSARGALRLRGAILANVEETINQLLETSPLLKRMAESQQIVLVGAYYELASGRVYFSEPARVLPRSSSSPARPATATPRPSSTSTHAAPAATPAASAAKPASTAPASATPAVSGAKTPASTATVPASATRAGGH